MIELIQLQVWNMNVHLFFLYAYSLKYKQIPRNF